MVRGRLSVSRIADHASRITHHGSRITDHAFRFTHHASSVNSLRFKTGPRTGEQVPLDKPKVTFGRKETCDCVLLHATVSREHFFIELNGRKYFAVDCGSGNGTLVNGERVTWAELKNGDQVQAGPFTFTAEFDDRDDPVLHLIVDQAPSGDSESSGPADSRESSGNLLSAWQHIYPREYLEGIVHFNAGRYYDAHEVWEEIWLRSSGDEKLFLQMLIQAAVSLHHYERGNLRGASNLYQAVLEKLKRFGDSYLDADLHGLSSSLRECLDVLLDKNEETTLPPLTSRPQIRLLPE